MNDLHVNIRKGNTQIHTNIHTNKINNNKKLTRNHQFIFKEKKVRNN